MKDRKQITPIVLALCLSVMASIPFISRADTKAVAPIVVTPVAVTTVTSIGAPAGYEGLEFRTQPFHAKAVTLFADSLAKTLPTTTDDKEYCEALDRAFMRQDPIVRASFAWDEGSYADALSRVSKESYAARFGSNDPQAYLDLQAKLGGLTSTETTDIGKLQTLRAKAMVRSATLETLVQGDKADTNLKTLFDASARCVTYRTNSADKDAVINDFRKVSVGGASVTTEETSTIVTRKDVTADTVTVALKDVASKDSLHNYFAGLIASNTELRSIESSSTAVKVTFAQPAKFLGAFRTWAKYTVTITPEGGASLSQSFKAKLSSEAADFTIDSIQAAIDTVKTEDTAFSVKTQASLANALSLYIVGAEAR